MCAAGLSRARLQAAGGGVLGWNGSVDMEAEEGVLHCVTRDTLCYIALYCYIHLVTPNDFSSCEDGQDII